MLDGLNWRERRLLDALSEHGSLTCWETKVPSRKDPGKHRLEYEVDVEGAGDKTIAALLARGLVRFEYEEEKDGTSTGKLIAND